MSAGKGTWRSRNLYLIGFMGAGKSIVGKILAEKLSRPFLDTDRMVEDKVGRTIAQIFQERGEEYFREVEREVVARATATPQTVVALGGGAILNARNRKAINQSGAAIYLKWEFAQLWPRLVNDRSRPLTLHLKPMEVEKLFNQRKRFYEQADFVIACHEPETPEQIAQKILRSLEVSK